ncbi:MAG: DUF2029 domain-containing protein [Rhodobacteraceae bacterium]|nr:DUF2029 domain-containing protein [Paracoccaceae bacterium]MCP5342050.1 DUF2029 domain-containing protein [Paracoccaceae bacterium]
MRDTPITMKPRSITLPIGMSRGELLLALLLAWFALVTMSLLVGMAFERAGEPGYDFRYFWVAGKVWAQGLSPYGGPFIEAAPRLIASGNIPDIWPYPPNLWLPCVALAPFDIETAWRIWLCVQLVAVVLASAALAFWLPLERVSATSTQSIGLARLGYFCLHIAFMASLEAMHLSVFVGQFSVPIYLSAVLILCGLARGWHGVVIAGLALSYMKPQIGAVLALALALSGRQGLRLVLASALVSLALIVPPMVVKATAVLDWLHETGAYDGIALANMAVAMTGIRHLLWVFAATGIGNIPALGITLVACGAVALFLRWAYSKNTGPWSAFAADMIVAQVLVIMAFSPLHMYDFVLIGVALPVLVRVRGPSLAAAIIGVAMFVKPTDVFVWLQGHRATSFFPGSTMATIGALILLLVVLGHAYESRRN